MRLVKALRFRERLFAAVSNSDFDQFSSTSPDDSHRFRPPAPDQTSHKETSHSKNSSHETAVSPAAATPQNHESHPQSHYAPHPDGVFRSRVRAKTGVINPPVRETQIIAVPDFQATDDELSQSEAKLSSARALNAQDEATRSDKSTLHLMTAPVAAHPARRETDLNGAPETVPATREANRTRPIPSSGVSSNANANANANTNTNTNTNTSNEYSNIEYSLQAPQLPSSSAPLEENAAAKSANSKTPTVPTTSRIEYFLEHILLCHFVQPPSLGASQWREEQREEAFNQQTMELFRLRLRLVTGMAMIMLLFHTLLYIYLAPDNTPAHTLMYVGLLAICLTARYVAQKLNSVDALRRLSLWCYAFFALGGALIVGVFGRGQMFILGGHNHILLTTLLLPFAAADCFFVAAMVIASLMISGYVTFMPHHSELYFSQIFTLCTTMAFTVFVAYFQKTLRRRAFDASFNAMCSMSRYQNMSLRDTLTGGHNRRFLMQTLETEIARAMRFSRPISLILFDLDNFKSVNDTLGHAAGDEVLVEVWHAATKAVRNVDTPARYGGDEFAIVLPEAAEDAAHEIASRLRTTTGAHLLHCFGQDSPQSKVTLSIGIVTLRPHDVITAEQLLFMADTQLYAAKKAGKNRIA